MQVQRFKTKQNEEQESCNTIEILKQKKCFPNLHLSLGHGCDGSGKTEIETMLSLSLPTASSRQQQIQCCSENHRDKQTKKWGS